MVNLMIDWFGYEVVKMVVYVIFNFWMMGFDLVLKFKLFMLLDILFDVLVFEDKVCICDIGVNLLDNEVDYVGFLMYKVGWVIGFEL